MDSREPALSRRLWAEPRADDRRRRYHDRRRIRPEGRDRHRPAGGDQGRPDLVPDERRPVARCRRQLGHRCQDGEITVGPDRVGAAPGPACFGLGGKEATITDVNLLLGVLDPATYLDGGFTLDADRSRARSARPSQNPWASRSRRRWCEWRRRTSSDRRVVRRTRGSRETTMAAFGGAGPMSACGAARLAGVHRVLVPARGGVLRLRNQLLRHRQSYEIGLARAATEAAGRRTTRCSACRAGHVPGGLRPGECAEVDAGGRGRGRRGWCPKPLPRRRCPRHRGRAAGVTELDVRPRFRTRLSHDEEVTARRPCRQDAAGPVHCRHVDECRSTCSTTRSPVPAPPVRRSSRDRSSPPASCPAGASTSLRRGRPHPHRRLLNRPRVTKGTRCESP